MINDNYNDNPVSVTKNTVYVWTEAVSAAKKLRFQKYPDTCGRVLNFF